MAGYIGTQAVSVNTTSATISDDLAVGDDATITGDLDVDGTTNLDVVDIDGAVNMATTALVTGVLTTTAATVFNGGFAAGGVGTFADGSAGAPSITNTGDLNTGILFPAADSIGLATNGTNRVTINGAGSVGIGVADGDVTGDATAARTYVGIIGTGNRGRLNLGTTAVNGADCASISFVNGTNELGAIFCDTTSGVQNTGLLAMTSTKDLKFQAAADNELVINESGADVDFRIESKDEENVFFVNGDTNRIGLGTNVPGSPLDIRQNTTSNAAFLLLRQIGSGDSSIDFQTTTSPNGFCIGVDGSDGDSFKIAVTPGDVGSDTAIRIANTGRIQILGILDSGSGTNLVARNSQATAISGTTQTTIVSAVNNALSSAAAAQIIVYGSNNSGNAFMDTVNCMSSQAVVVAQSSTLDGSPHGRTYAISGTALKLTLASGASGYNVNCSVTTLNFPF